MNNFAKTFCSLINRSQIVKQAKYKYKFPKLAIAPSASLLIDGILEYGDACSVNVGANIIVPLKSKLELGKECYIGRYVELGPTHVIKIGDYTSLQDRCIFVGDVVIGRYCLFSLNVLITSGKHHFDQYPHLLIRDQDQMTFAKGQEGKSVTIHDDCWIGVNTVITQGVTIGKGSIIGANSVVTNDIPPYSVAVGAPARVLRQRLNFIPPAQITYNNALDYPYFYSGVEISCRERIAMLTLEGLLTKNNFQLALNAPKMNKIMLKVKASTGEQIIQYQDRQQSIGEKFEEVAFDVNPHTQPIFDFSCHSKNAQSKLILQKAWLV